MVHILNLNNINSLGAYDNPITWYADQTRALNNVLPSLIHQYDKNRYYNSSDGETRFPFTATRAGNATQYDNQGRIVWAPANNIFDSRGGSAVVGPSTGSNIGGVWSTSDTTAQGVSREIVGKGVLGEEDYIDIRYYGTNISAGNIFPDLVFHITTAAPVTVPGEIWTASGNFQIIGGSSSGFLPTGRPRFLLRFMTTAGGYVGGGPGTSLTNEDRFMVSTGIAPATTGRVSAFIDLAIPPGNTVDCTFRVRGIRLERTSVDSPKRYIRTTGNPKYCPRLDYDPLTLAPRGLLIESTATNIILTSTAVSTVSGGTSAVSPAIHLGQSAMRITFDTLTGGHFGANGSLIANPSTQYTVSCYYVPISGGNDLIQLAVTAGASTTDVYVNFNTATVTRTALGVGATNGTIQNCGNGVFRLSLTFTSTPTTSGGSVVILAKIATGTDTRIPSVLGAGEIFDFFGCQMELGSEASSLIPTYGVSTTRGGDTLEVATSSWFTQGSGTLFIEYVAPQYLSGSFPPLVVLDDGTANNRIQSFFQTNASNVNFGARIDNATVVQVNTTTPGTINYNVTATAALAYADNSTRMVQNGGAVTTDLVCTIPTGLTTLRVGKNLGATARIRWIKEIRFYPSVSASDTQLQTLTTP